MENETKDKYAHLRKYQWKPGERPAGAGKKKGSRDKKTKLTMEILEEALITDPKTGREMSAKRLRMLLSRQIWSANNKVLLDVINRKLGKVPDKIEGEQVHYIITSAPRPDELSSNNDKDSIIEGEVVSYEIGDKSEVVDK